MGRPPSKTRYLSVTLPEPLVEQIREAIEADDSRFYTSVPDFIKDAVRQLLGDLDNKKRLAKVGRKLDDLAPDADRAAAKLRAGGPRGKFCHNCGSALNGPFCSNCGTKAP